MSDVSDRIDVILRGSKDHAAICGCDLSNPPGVGHTSPGKEGK